MVRASARPAGSAPALAFRHAQGPHPFGPRAESEGGLFCGGRKPEAACLAGTSVGEELAGLGVRVDVALRLGTGIRIQPVRESVPASGRKKEQCPSVPKRGKRDRTGLVWGSERTLVWGGRGWDKVQMGGFK